MVTTLGLGWRWIFVLSIVPAMTSLLLRRRVTESEVWQSTRERMGTTRTTLRGIARDRAAARRFCYLIVLMTALNLMAHSARDPYPTFLKATANQIGNLFASLNLPLQEHLAAWHGYPFALACTVAPALLAVLVTTATGPEAKGAVFGASPDPAEEEGAEGIEGLGRLGLEPGTGGL